MKIDTINYCKYPTNSIFIALVWLVVQKLKAQCQPILSIGSKFIRKGILKKVYRKLKDFCVHYGKLVTKNFPICLNSWRLRKWKTTDIFLKFLSFLHDGLLYKGIILISFRKIKMKCWKNNDTIIFWIISDLIFRFI